MKKLFTFFFFVFNLVHIDAQIIISEIYGGANATSPNSCDYVVIKNAGSSSVAIGGYKLYYGSASNSTAPSVSVTVPAATNLAAGATYVIQLACTAGNTNPSTPYGTGIQSGATNMGATAGRVYLTTGAAPGGTACAPTGVLGSVFYGSQTSCTSNAPAPSVTSSIVSTDGINFTTNLLPVKLVVFSILKNQINFVTASENNNSHFLIEHSSNGRDFLEKGRLAGAGFSNQIINYSFTDPSQSKGFNYYRLKQVDFDGRFEYSKIISSYVGNKTFETTVISAQSDVLRLNIFSQVTDDATISLFDTNGRLVASQAVSLNENSNEVTMNVNLQNGIYIVKVANSNGEQVSKMLNVR